MAGGTGSLDALGCPTIQIEVTGGLPNVKRPLTALIDTGFSGFLSIPMLEAFPIGLLLHGTTTVVLADGTRHSKFTCLGSVHFGGEVRTGIIIIEPVGDGALLGMEFLKKFRLSLLTDPDSGAVVLFDSDLLKQILAGTSTGPKKQ